MLDFSGFRNSAERSRQCHGDHRSSDQRQSHDKSGCLAVPDFRDGSGMFRV